MFIKKSRVMNCPNCKSNNLKVLEKRDIEGEPTAIRRRRECLECNFRFTTYEKPDIPGIMVVKKDGTKEAFDREKMSKGVRKALEKRPVDEETLSDLLEKVEREIFAVGEKEVTSQAIGDLVLKKLSNLDEVAYIRFASVYKSFDNIGSFKSEAEKLRHKAKL